MPVAMIGRFNQICVGITRMIYPYWSILETRGSLSFRALVLNIYVLL
jgi:hypothetical protein